MSDAVSEVSAENVEQQAALWIDRRDRADWTTQDQVELEAWLAQSMIHAIAFWRLNAAWKRTERLAALRRASQWNRRVWNRNSAKPLVAGSAIALALVAIVAGSFVYLKEPASHTYSTPVGGREVLSLADGSQIELNTDTVLRIAGKADTRKVWLDRGEAYFQIRHNAAHPFIVNVSGHRVTDIGTKFSIRTDAHRTEIALTEGSAKVEAASGSDGVPPVTLKPGDVAIATAKSIYVTKKPERLLDDELGWRRGVLIFDNTTLAEAAVQFNRYSMRKLVVEGAAANLRVDGTFPSNDSAAFTAIVGHILHLKVRESDSEVLISRR